MASLSQQKKHLSFSALKQAISLHFHAIKDSRVQGKCDYSQHDVLMSAFACMYFQDPSLSELMCSGTIEPFHSPKVFSQR
ncbi:hypothetical protein [sulfur-oxidizing endosymbiont of Gigantopelta aegis]|uniref:hypothetical protein n=1 Tax=sulfur-oxidizing endosymbiont of Gigantopelta aegis TaxID=2794934 RepID=UPI0018DC9722|nr:hypothetical protein [sulfur-oxidizing endosymbiont of Gigantopelta aegis]